MIDNTKTAKLLATMVWMMKTWRYWVSKIFGWRALVWLEFEVVARLRRR